jgi:DNA-binding transcriptional ArsR family regulator
MSKTFLPEASVNAEQLTKTGAYELSPNALALVAEFFKVLSEANRLQIVCCLKSGSKNVTEIITATGLGQANVSKHLKILSQAGIVSRQPQGANVYYQISNPCIFDLCELVCNSLMLQLQERNQHLDQLRNLGNRE